MDDHRSLKCMLTLHGMSSDLGISDNRVLEWIKDLVVIRLSLCLYWLMQKKKEKKKINIQRSRGCKSNAWPQVAVKFKDELLQISNNLLLA